MKPFNRILHGTALAVVIGLTCALSLSTAQGGDTKPFKETGTETVVTGLGPGALLQPLFAEARETYGPEVWSGIILQYSHNNVGGRGVSVLFEAVHLDPAAPTGVIIAVMKYETVANGDQFVVSGYVVPQGDGTYAIDASLEPGLGTGRFANATATFTKLAAIPGGYVLEGTMTTVGAAKK
jgi:hypothetical protein